MASITTKFPNVLEDGAAQRPNLNESIAIQNHFNWSI
jgi:hypothetical protein